MFLMFAHGRYVDVSEVALAEEIHGPCILGLADRRSKFVFGSISDTKGALIALREN